MIPTSYTHQLIDFALGIESRDLGDDGRRTVELAFADAIGCALAGSNSEEASIAGAWAGHVGALDEATIIGRPGRLPASLAALVNATAAHALDYDDVSPLMTHPSACLVPPLLAVAERERSSGADVMAAYVTGFEVCVRLCRLLNPGHYYRGWHSMGTVNGLGVAAAVGRLMGLDASTVRTAVAIAASSSAGIRKNFGTFVKPLHAGQAAFHGLQAAELAAAGFVADDAVLDGEHGFLHVFGDPAVELPPAVERPLELVASGLIFKRFASCGALHPAMDAVIGIVDDRSLTADHIASIRCAVNSRAPHVLVHHRATTPAEGRFSVEYSLAVAAIDRQGGPAQYTPARVGDPVVQDLAARVEVYVDDDLPCGYAQFPAIVEVRTTDGETIRSRVDHARGSPQAPLSDADMAAKLAHCAAFALAPVPAQRAIEAIEGLLRADDVGPHARALAG